MRLQAVIISMLVFGTTAMAQTAGTSNTLGNNGITSIQSYTASGYKLSVGGAVKIFKDGNSGLNSPSLYLSNISSTGGKNYYLNSDDNGSFRIVDSNANTVRFLINTSGNIGIGTTSPSTKLHIVGSSGSFRLADGTEGANKVLTSDANGVATWQTASGGGITSLNTLTGATQTFAKGTTAQSNDWGIVSSGSSHTFHFPDASATNRGLLTTGDWTTFNNKAAATGAAGYIQNQTTTAQSASFRINGTMKLDGTTSGTVTMQPAAEAGTWAMTLPTDAGTNGQILSTNGSGVTSWITPSGGGGGITSLNTLTGASQTFATGTSGTDFGISSSGTVHTFNIPDASASARGLITNGSQTLAGNKTLNGALIIQKDGTSIEILNGTGSQSIGTIGRGDDASLGIAASLVGLSLSSGASAAGGISIKAIHSSAPITLSTSAVERMRIDPGGNVGIGTASPDSKLHIAGSLKIVDGTQSNGYVFTSDANGLGSWQAPTGGSSQWTTTGNNIYYNTGNVGVGTTAPKSSLQVDFLSTGTGTVTTNGTTTLTGTSTQFTTNLKVGSSITVSGETRTVNSIISDNSLAVSVAFTSSLSNIPFTLNNYGRKLAVGERQIFIGQLVAGQGGDGGQGTSTVFGLGALANTNNGAFQNDAFGFVAGSSITSGHDNTALGSFSLQFNTTGSNNVAIGRDAMENSVTGWYNTAIGVASLYDMGATSGSNNTAIGRSSGRGITTGSGNTIVGAFVTGLAGALTNTVIISDGSNTGASGYRFYSPASGNVLIGTTVDAGYKFEVNGTTRLNNSLAVDATGNVGIGTSTPAYKLDVSGSFKLADGTQGAGKVLTSDANGVASWQTATGGGSSLWTDAGGGNIYNTTQSGSVGIGTNSPQANLDVNGTVRLNNSLVVNANGTVGIGTITTYPTTGNYKLAVAGDIIAEKVRVKLQSNGWPDYVFHPNYNLPTLAETEAFIKKNNHLSGVPSAAEIEKEGLDLGDGQAVLLKKIEELTLHMIGMNKKLERLETENEMMKKKINKKR